MMPKKRFSIKYQTGDPAVWKRDTQFLLVKKHEDRNSDIDLGGRDVTPLASCAGES